MGKKFVNHLNYNEETNEVEVWSKGKFFEITSKDIKPKTAPVRDSQGFIPINYLEGDFGGGFANINLPTPELQTILIAKDTNATTPGNRLYVFDGTSWHYVDLT